MRIAIYIPGLFSTPTKMKRPGDEAITGLALMVRTVSLVVSRQRLKASPAHKCCRGYLRHRQSDYFVGSLGLVCVQAAV